MIKIGIIGGAGYTAGELLRILAGHPKADIVWVHSNSHANEPIYKAHKDLRGDLDLTFTNKIDYTNIVVVYLCMGHGASVKFLTENPVPENVKIIDLSTDFRHKETANGFVYGLPELNRDEIKKATKIANPGCFATTVQLAILPLAKKGVLNEVHVHAITGSTGAGQAPAPTTHFSWRDNNISIYNAFTHRHLKEIGESVNQLMPSFDAPINFIPMRGDFARGILASVYVDCDLSLEEAEKIYDDFYKEHPFTFRSEEPIDLKQVVNTNKCFLHLAKHGNKLHIISITDNLTKGASGQAVQNMNLIFGIDEKTGLYLKPSAF